MPSQRCNMYSRKHQKKGHFQHMCRSKSVAAVSVESTDYEFLGTITSSQVDSAEAGGKPWMVRLQMNNQLMEFKIDSGADVTVIAEKKYGMDHYRFLRGLSCHRWSPKNRSPKNRSPRTICSNICCCGWSSQTKYGCHR